MIENHANDSRRPNLTTNSRFGKQLLWAIPLFVLVAGGAGAAAMMRQPAPANLDLSLTQPSDQGLYVGTLLPMVSPIPVGTIQSWTISVATADGVPLEHATLSFDGGMPQHGHGLPTQPLVTQELGGGKYRLEGVKFNMSGWWKLDLAIDGPAGTDHASFNLVL